MANPTFEESLQELEQIVTRLEQGDVPLEEALDAFQKGMSKAEKSLTKMMTESNEEVPFEEESQ